MSTSLTALCMAVPWALLALACWYPPSIRQRRKIAFLHTLVAAGLALAGVVGLAVDYGRSNADVQLNNLEALRATCADIRAGASSTELDEAMLDRFDITSKFAARALVMAIRDNHCGDGPLPPLEGD